MDPAAVQGVARLVGDNVERVIVGKRHEVLLVLDAVTGQNGLEQARQFTQALTVTGIILTKLDGTAKGGMAVAIQRARELAPPGAEVEVECDSIEQVGAADVGLGANDVGLAAIDHLLCASAGEHAVVGDGMTTGDIKTVRCIHRNAHLILVYTLLDN